MDQFTRGLKIEILAGNTIRQAVETAAARARESGKAVSFVFGYYNLEVVVNPGARQENVVQEYCGRADAIRQQNKKDHRDAAFKEVEDLMAARPAADKGEDALAAWSELVRVKLIELVEYKLEHTMR